MVSVTYGTSLLLRRNVGSEQNCNLPWAFLFQASHWPAERGRLSFWPIVVLLLLLWCFRLFARKSRRSEAGQEGDELYWWKETPPPCYCQQQRKKASPLTEPTPQGRENQHVTFFSSPTMHVISKSIMKIFGCVCVQMHYRTKWEISCRTRRLHTTRCRWESVVLRASGALHRITYCLWELVIWSSVAHRVSMTVSHFAKTQECVIICCGFSVGWLQSLKPHRGEKQAHYWLEENKCVDETCWVINQKSIEHP